jgi:hypothetical protein
VVVDVDDRVFELSPVGEEGGDVGGEVGCGAGAVGGGWVDEALLEIDY